MRNGNEKKIVFYGAPWCPDCKRVKKLLGEYKVDYEYINIENSKIAIDYIEKVNNGLKIIPTLVLPNKEVLAEPTNEELLSALKLQKLEKDKYWDLLIVGGGPAGLTSAIFASRYGIETAILEKNSPGGEAYLIDLIDNFPGFPEGISGHSLTTKLVRQAEKYGTEIISAEVTKIEGQGIYRKVSTSSGEFLAKSVIIATGSEYMKLKAPGESELTGKGVHYCAPCDGPFYKNKELAVVGGGNSAFEEAIALSRYASKVKILIREEKIAANEVLQTKVRRMKSKIEVVLSTQVVKFIGENKLQKVLLRNSKTTEIKETKFDGVFICIGLKPITNFLKDSLELDERGYIVTSSNLETSIKGVFAAGNNRSGATAQLASAAGEGTTAAMMAKLYIEKK